MADHISKSVADHVADNGCQKYIEQYDHDMQSKCGHRPNYHGFKNTMKIQCDWHKTRQRLQSKLEGRRIQTQEAQVHKKSMA